MRLATALVLAVALGLVGTEYAAIGIASVGLAVALYAHVRLGRVSAELEAVQSRQRTVADDLTSKARSIEREFGDPDSGS